MQQAIYLLQNHSPTAFEPRGAGNHYHNAAGELLETSIGNLILKIAGKLYTPPTSLGILPGIYRQHLLEIGQAEEKVLTLKDLAKQKIFTPVMQSGACMSCQ